MALGGGALTPLVVGIILDQALFQKGMKQVETSGQRLDKSMSRSFGNITRYATIAAAAFAAFAHKAIGVAAESEAATIKFNAVFGKEAEKTLAWADKMSEAFLITRTEMQQMLSRTQDLLVPMGLNRKEAAKYSQTVTEMALKLAEFNGQPTEQTMAAIQSALVGMSKPMQRYGVMVSAARVEQEILNQGLARTKDEITDQMKVMARINIIQNDSADALRKVSGVMGDVRASQKKFTKVWAEMTEEIGFALAPILAEIVDVLKPIIHDMTEWIKKNKDATRFLGDLIGVLGRGAADMLKFWDAVSKGETALAYVFPQLKVLRDVIETTGDIARANQRVVELEKDQAQKSMELHKKRLARHVQLLTANKDYVEVLRDYVEVEQASIDTGYGFAKSAEVQAEWFDVLQKRLSDMTIEDLPALGSEVETLQARLAELTATGQKTTPQMEAIGRAIGAIEARMKELDPLDVTANFKQIHQNIVGFLRKTVRRTREAMAEQVRLRTEASQKILAAQERLLDIDLRLEKTVFEIELRAPGMDELEKRVAIEKRIADLRQRAIELGKTDAKGAREALETARTLTLQLMDLQVGPEELARRLAALELERKTVSFMSQEYMDLTNQMAELKKSWDALYGERATQEQVKGALRDIAGELKKLEEIELQEAQEQFAATARTMAQLVAATEAEVKVLEVDFAQALEAARQRMVDLSKEKIKPKIELDLTKAEEQLEEFRRRAQRAMRIGAVAGTTGAITTGRELDVAEVAKETEDAMRRGEVP